MPGVAPSRSEKNSRTQRTKHCFLAAIQAAPQVLSYLVFHNRYSSTTPRSPSRPSPP